MTDAIDNNLTSLLLDAQSAEPDRRKNAEAQLSSAESSNFIEYSKALCRVLANETKQEATRQLAGLMFKNAISGQDPKIDAAKREKWVELPVQISGEIKDVLLKALENCCSCVLARNAVCQVISKIARIEVPSGQWPQLMQQIDALSGSDKFHRTSAYQVLGYVCEDAQILSDEVGRDLLDDNMKQRILKLLSQGLMDQDLDVKLAALKAFYYGILFAEQFLQAETDRSGLFGVLSQCLQVPRPDVELAAWEVMLQIAAEFYPVLGPYLAGVRDLSLARINGPVASTALSAIEFWSTICDEEILIMEGGDIRQSCQYISANKDALLPVLFEATTKQDDEDSAEDEWTVSMAAGTSIGLCAQVLRDEILVYALAFIEANFGAPDWNRREAAVLVYGSILEGPSPGAFTQLLGQSFQHLCQRLNDDSKAVRDTTAWTIGRVAKFHFQTIVHTLGSSPDQPGLIPLLRSKLGDEPRVSAHVCFALYEICDQCRQGEVSTAPCIDPFFTSLADAFAQVAKRPDASEHGLRKSAYHSLYALVMAVQDTHAQSENLRILLNQLCDWMDETFMQGYSEEVSAIQGSMCGCLNALITRLDKLSIPYADRLFSIFQRSIQAQGALVERGGAWDPTAEEALLACNKLLATMQTSFVRYLSSFCVLLVPVLKSQDDSELCGIAIDIVGNLATHMGDELGPFVSHFAPELFAILRDRSAPMMLKPKAMNTLGDMAVMCPVAFQSYVTDFFDILKTAAKARVKEGPTQSEEWIEYLKELRDATLTAYTSCIYAIRDIVQGSRAHQGANLPELSLSVLENEVSTMLDLIQNVISDPTSSNSNIKNAISLTQDLVQFFKAKLVGHIKERPMYAMLRERCSGSSDIEVRSHFLALDEMCTTYHV